MRVYSCAKFEVSSIILTSFWQGRGLGDNSPSPPRKKKEPLKSPPRLGLMIKIITFINFENLCGNNFCVQTFPWLISNNAVKKPLVFIRACLMHYVLHLINVIQTWDLVIGWDATPKICEIWLKIYSLLETRL